MTDESMDGQQPTLLTVDDKTYDVANIPDEVKVLVNDLIRLNQELTELQYRLRHSQAAQQTYVATIKAELERLQIPPYEGADPNLSGPAD
ncbi:MAG: hypothetical protein FJ333_08505 [Sphingomonadales bacterium]|nr:hypothetical protein [Sphingomonadales bacterium]